MTEKIATERLFVKQPDKHGKDNDRGYHLDNAVSCCRICNIVKNSFFSADEMMSGIGAAIRNVKLARLVKAKQ
jgi:hypothetical protein